MSDEPATLDLFGREQRGAEISDCGQFRYKLWRHWGDEPPALFVMLNPSTADANVDDPTIRRCIGFARRWGCGGIYVGNLYPFRATNPDVLSHSASPFGEPGRPRRNDDAIWEMACEAGMIVAAWGAWPGPLTGRPRRMLELLTLADDEVFALGLTKKGAPRHPLYVRADAELVRLDHV